MRRALLFVTAFAALAAPAAAEAQTTLYGSIQSGVIALRDASGNPVTQVPSGTYTFQITDLDAIHNFHLETTAVDTPIEGTGVFTYTGVVLTQGTYTYLCDVHPDINGTLVVGAPPPPPPPATISGLSVRKVAGVRVVTITFRVARHATAKAQLRRPARAWASGHAHLMPGTRKLKVKVPARAPQGLYTLKITLTDLGTNAKTIRTRSVRLPRA